MQAGRQLTATAADWLRPTYWPGTSAATALLLTHCAVPLLQLHVSDAIVGCLSSRPCRLGDLIISHVRLQHIQMWVWWGDDSFPFTA